MSILRFPPTIRKEHVFLPANFLPRSLSLFMRGIHFPQEFITSAHSTKPQIVSHPPLLISASSLRLI